MVGNKAIVELQETIRDLINAHLESEDMTIAELIGILEICKLDAYYQNMIEDEDDTEE